MHNIVITDGYTLNPGDLSWEIFNSLGKVTIYDRTSEDQVMERCRDATVIITNKTIIQSGVIRAAKSLKLIAVTATGYNVVDIEAARNAKVPVCNVPAYGTDSVAQHTFALIFELTNRVGLNSESVFKNEWSKSLDWCYSKAPITELSGKTLGIVGYGRIGQKVAAIAKALGMNVIFHSRSLKKESGQVSLREVFSTSDIVSLHLPLQADNVGFVNNDLLALMKPSAFLINTSRGQLIQEDHLAESLRKNKIAGAALDVLSKEPPMAGHILIGLNNCIITPHTAWLSTEARTRIMQTTFANVKSAIEGHPQNIVNL